MIRFVCVVVILVTFLIRDDPGLFCRMADREVQSERERLQFAAHRTVGI